jgi:hypothetical protein
LTTFSQTGTRTNCTLPAKDTCKTILSCDIARKIVVDLLKGDSAIAELKLTQTLLEQEREASAAKDTAYNALDEKFQLSDKALKTCMDAGERFKKIVTNLESDNAKLQTKITRWKRVSGILVLIVGGILLLN